jgi:hypothetical protein
MIVGSYWSDNRYCYPEDSALSRFLFVVSIGDINRAIASGDLRHDETNPDTNRASYDATVAYLLCVRENAARHVIGVARIDEQDYHVRFQTPGNFDEAPRRPTSSIEGGHALPVVSDERIVAVTIEELREWAQRRPECEGWDWSSIAARRAGELLEQEFVRHSYTERIVVDGSDNPIGFRSHFIPQFEDSGLAWAARRGITPAVADDFQDSNRIDTGTWQITDPVITGDFVPTPIVGIDEAPGTDSSAITVLQPYQDYTVRVQSRDVIARQNAYTPAEFDPTDQVPPAIEIARDIALDV